MQLGKSALSGNKMNLAKVSQILVDLRKRDPHIFMMHFEQQQA
jgi:hypothetical protein